MFVLDPAFESASAPLAVLALCEVRLQLDDRFPWLVLIPQVAAAREVDDLDPAARTLFLAEIIRAGDAARAVGAASGRPVEKLNIGLLGNITPQLHAHVVGRREDDPAWPGPVWGHGAASPYEPGRLEELRRVAIRVLIGP